MSGFFVLLLIGGLGRPPQAAPGACDLLTDERIRSVQGASVKDRKASRSTSQAMTFAQCFFAVEDLARSVSLTVISGTDPGSARAYWKRTFEQSEREERQEPEEAEARPRAIAGAGDEAIWTGDARAGSLYVLSRDVIVRISVGGVTEDQERIRRSKALALAALERLRNR